jgi:hypothetical protein
MTLFGGADPRPGGVQVDQIRDRLTSICLSEMASQRLPLPFGRE